MSDWLYKISSYATLLPILIALFRYKYLDRCLWWYLGSLLVSYICNIISLKLGENNINNHFMIYVSACLNFILRALLFYTFIDSKVYRKILIFSVIAYLSGICVDIFVHGIYMNQYLYMVSDVWVTFFLIVCLNQILKDESIESLRNLPIFWVIIGTLINVVFDFFLSVSNGWLYTVNRAFFFMLWDYITPIFTFIKIILVSIGYWKTKKYAESLVKT